MSTQAARKGVAPPRTLDELAEELLPLAIDSERSYRKMLRVIDRLAVLDKRTKAQQRYLDTLTILVEVYEDDRHAIDLSDMTPIDALEYLMDQHGMSGRDLGRLLGQPQLGSKILRGERELSKAHIRKLCDHFQVGPELFV